MALLELLAQDWEESFPNSKDNAYRITIDKINETRTIKIKGKNIDDLNLKKMTKLIQQSTEKSSKFNLRSLFKGLKRAQPKSVQ